MRRSALSRCEAAGSRFGLYDHEGVLRVAGAAEAECLAYAALFGLADNSFSLVPLGADRFDPTADCSN